MKSRDIVNLMLVDDATIKPDGSYRFRRKNDNYYLKIYECSVVASNVVDFMRA